MTNLEMVHAMFDAVERRDIDKYASFYAPDAVVWQNTVPWDQPATEVPKRMRGLWEKRKEWRYADRRYFEVPGGVVCQHVSTSVGLDDKPGQVHVMARFHIKDGKVTRFEEYVPGAVQQKP